MNLSTHPRPPNHEPDAERREALLAPLQACFESHPERHVGIA